MTKCRLPFKCAGLIESRKCNWPNFGLRLPVDHQEKSTQLPPSQAPYQKETRRNRDYALPQVLYPNEVACLNCREANKALLEKIKLDKMILSNPTLLDRTMRFTYKKPLDDLFALTDLPVWWTRRLRSRTRGPPQNRCIAPRLYWDQLPS